MLRRPVLTQVLGLALVIGVLCGPASALGTLDQAATDINTGNYGGAIALLQGYISRFPNDPRPYLWLTKAYEATFQVDKLADAEQKYNELTANRQQILRNLAGTEPPAIYQAMLQEEPGNLETELLLAISYYDAKQYARAATVFKLLPQASLPQEIQAPTLLLGGMLALQSKQYDAARVQFLAASKLEADNPLPERELDQLNALMTTQGTPTADASKSLQPADSAVRTFQLTYQLGQSLMLQGKYQGAVDALEEAVEAAPDNATASALLTRAKALRAFQLVQDAKALQSNGDLVGAKDVLSTALQLDPASADALGLLAEIQAAPLKQVAVSTAASTPAVTVALSAEVPAATPSAAASGSIRL